MVRFCLRAPNRENRLEVAGAAETVAESLDEEVVVVVDEAADPAVRAEAGLFNEGAGREARHREGGARLLMSSRLSPRLRDAEGVCPTLPLLMASVISQQMMR